MTDEVQGQGNWARAPVLVIEDDAPLRRSIVVALRLVGCPVREAGDAASARRALREERPAVVVTDLRVRGFADPGEVLRTVSTQASESSIVVVTGESPSGLRCPAVRAWLQKPCSLGRLRRAVAEALEAASAGGFGPGSREDDGPEGD